MKKHIITITGDHASGQGTLSNLLKEKLGYEIYRNGQYVRSLAKDMNMTIVEFQEYLNMHEELDREIENSAKNYAASHDNLIIDAKLGWYVVPSSFKVYLKVDLDIASQRVYNDENRKDSERFYSIEEVKKQIKYRYNEENNRWYKTYGIHRDDMSNYDLVIDTTTMNPEDVCDLVIKEYNKWLED